MNSCASPQWSFKPPGAIHAHAVGRPRPPERPQPEWMWMLALILFAVLQSGSLKKIGEPEVFLPDHVLRAERRVGLSPSNRDRLVGVDGEVRRLLDQVVVRVVGIRAARGPRAGGASGRRSSGSWSPTPWWSFPGRRPRSIRRRCRQRRSSRRSLAEPPVLLSRRSRRCRPSHPDSRQRRSSRLHRSCCRTRRSSPYHCPG